HGGASNLGLIVLASQPPRIAGQICMIRVANPWRGARFGLGWRGGSRGTAILTHALEQVSLWSDQRIGRAASTRAGAFQVIMTGLLAQGWCMRVSLALPAQGGPTRPKRSRRLQRRMRTRM